LGHSVTPFVWTLAWQAAQSSTQLEMPHAMVMPKGRDAGLAYARQFIEDAKSEGQVKAAIERVGMRGAVVALSQ